MDTFHMVDYKGKYFVLQDELFELDYSIGLIDKKTVLKKSYIKNHKKNCQYYGIPAYVGDDEDMKKAYN